MPLFSSKFNFKSGKSIPIATRYQIAKEAKRLGIKDHSLEYQNGKFMINAVGADLSKLEQLRKFTENQVKSYDKNAQFGVKSKIQEAHLTNVQQPIEQKTISQTTPTGDKSNGFATQNFKVNNSVSPINQPNQSNNVPILPNNGNFLASNQLINSGLGKTEAEVVQERIRNRQNQDMEENLLKNSFNGQTSDSGGNSGKIEWSSESEVDQLSQIEGNNE
jgi:hypothetical protein